MVERVEDCALEQPTRAHLGDGALREPAVHRETLGRSGLLQLDREIRASLFGPGTDLRERRDPLTRKLRSEVAARVEVPDLRQRALAKRTVTARGSVQRFVVHEDRDTVLGPLDVELHLVGPIAHAPRERRDGVFRSARRSAAVTNHANACAHRSERIVPRPWTPTRSRAFSLACRSSARSPTRNAQRGRRTSVLATSHATRSVSILLTPRGIFLSSRRAR